MSFLAWIDFDQNDRDRTRRIMDLFGEEDTRDELGLGGIRDALSDLMFPGTSTIQTRLRYFFFVPWVYQQAARAEGSVASRIALARDLEIRLIEALLRGGERLGVIGSEAREGLKRLPSDVYWAGLGVLGIRRFAGSRQTYLERNSGAHDDENETVISPWSPGLPSPPEGWLETTSFRLRPDEADFLFDRLMASRPEALFTELARMNVPVSCDEIWLHPARAGWSERNRQIVEQAQILASVVHGAALLYNLMLAEKAAIAHGIESPEMESRIEDYRARLDTWRDGLDLVAAANWSLEDLWELISETTFRITGATRNFVEDWREIALARSEAIVHDDAARALIREREIRLKGGKSRFRNAAALDRWGGASGTARFNFRWPIVQSHLRDLADAR